MSTDTIEPTEAPQAAAPAVIDYWGTDEKKKWYFPDGVQFMEFQIMNEGAKVQFQKLTNQDLIVNRDNTAKVKVDPATERHTLITTSVTGWHMFKLVKGVAEPVAYAPQLLRKWLEVADPKIVEELEHAIRLANPWMQAEMPLEEVDKEIERLQDLRKQIIEREAGEASSATK